MTRVVCPYCGSEARLIDSVFIYGRSYGKIWLCGRYPECDAYVGVHKNSRAHVPLGRMANAELREWKKRAHSAFDRFWRGKMSRSSGYRELARRLEMPHSAAHIGMFDVKECKAVVEAFGESNLERVEARGSKQATLV